MATAREVATKHINALMDEINELKLSRDAVARIMLEKAIAIYREERDIEDIAAELQGAAENLDPDADFMFMRP
ncbi:MAG: hypothetical protein P1U50_01280 [Parvibaculaceae bacterium]|nr:hypothetical protein [Parvibaculaceae bacterium]